MTLVCKRYGRTSLIVLYFTHPLLEQARSHHLRTKATNQDTAATGKHFHAIAHLTLQSFSRESIISIFRSCTSTQSRQSLYLFVPWLSQGTRFERLCLMSVTTQVQTPRRTESACCYGTEAFYLATARSARSLVAD